MGLLTTARVAIDGKFRAVNTRDKNFTRGRVERRHVQLEQSVARYLAQLDTRRPAGAIGRACGEENAFEFKQTWRLGDLGAKHALLLAGIGWGNMPAATVRAGLQSGRLARLTCCTGAAAHSRCISSTRRVPRRVLPGDG